MISALLVASLLAQAPDAGSADDQTRAADARVAAAFVASGEGVEEAQAELRAVLDGGQALTLVDLYAPCGSAPPMVAVDGGYFVPERRQQRYNCKLATLEPLAVAKLNEDNAPPHPGVVLALAGGGVTIAVVAFVAGFLLPHPQQPPAK